MFSLTFANFGPSVGDRLICFGVVAENKPMNAGAMPLQSFPWKEADEMLTLLVGRAAVLTNCVPGSPEEREFDKLACAIEAYDAKRRPDGRPRRRR